jgi:hypothetical protein
MLHKGKGKNKMIDLDTPLFKLTVREFLEILKQPEPQKPNNTGKKYLYGIRGICEIFGCKPTKANEIKASGIIDKAITQHGRSIIIDVELALELTK